MRPKISIVIPSFNKVAYIGLTLESIFAQRYPNLEVIIQDGGSTDGTVEVIKKFARKYKIIWESKKDKGQLDAINNGLKKATGEILTYINADDTYRLGALNLVSKSYLKNKDALWFAGKGTIINSQGKEIAKPVTFYKNILFFLNSRLLLLVANYLIQPSVFLTTKAFNKYGPFTGTSNFVMEYDLWLKLSKIEMPVIINKNLSKFRIESSTKTKTMSLLLLSEDRKVVNRYTKNRLILFLHDLNNFGRILVNRFV